MNLSQLKELVRIIAYMIGAGFFGEAVADGEQFQAVLSGLVSIVAFIWWIYTKRVEAANNQSLRSTP